MFPNAAIYEFPPMHCMDKLIHQAIDPKYSKANTTNQDNMFLTYTWSQIRKRKDIESNLLSK
jgi:hypothetical protein